MSRPTALRMLVVLGEGGHTAEILRLVDLMGETYTYHYLLAVGDPLSEQWIRIPGPVHRIQRPRAKHESWPSVAWHLLVSGWQALQVVRRVRPHALLGSGPALMVPVAFFAKLFGAQIIHVETGSRVTRLSLTGRLMYRWADLFFVQWPDLCKKYPKAIYAGRLY